MTLGNRGNTGGLIGTTTRMKESTTAFLGHGSASPLKHGTAPSDGLSVCFLINNDSYLEMRDCFIQSIKDPSVIESEKGEVINAQLLGIQEPEFTDVMDTCFCIN
jgi:hypothetical protein